MPACPWHSDFVSGMLTLRHALIFWAHGVLTLFNILKILFQEPEILESQSNMMLTAIINGMKKEEPR